MLEWCCVAAVNDDDILDSNLALSPAIARNPTRLVTFRDQPSASRAYNKGLRTTDARIYIFVHQDVYLPTGWEDQLQRQINQLDEQDPSWAVAGVYGVGKDGHHVGRVWSSGIGKELGAPLAAPVQVQSLDELLIILRGSSGLRFDDQLPSFHLYGTDIVQSAIAAGHSAYVIHSPVVHNSRSVRTLKGGYMEAYNYMRLKWRARLPIATPVTTITRFGFQARWKVVKKRYLRKFLQPSYEPRTSEDPPCNPVLIARHLGYE